jgi:hexosaminidase
MSEPQLLIPAPASIERLDGTFLFDQETAVRAGDGCEQAAAFLTELIRPPTGFPLPAEPGENTNALALAVGRGMKKGGYVLDVTHERIAMEASDPQGLFNGCRALRQLLGPEIESREKVPDCAWTVPAVRVRDEPRFEWRGLMLDPARGFQPVAAIKSVIELMALYSMNRLHLHLTDDQAWCIEIPGYPKLTSDGRCYSRDDIQDLVAYAASRHIMVIPEIDMPGHTTAAVNAYPQFSCTGAPVARPARGGNYADIFCPGSDELYGFIETVLSECAEIFPAPYIHIGGDETIKTNWKVCPRCGKRMREERLRNEKELEHYFVSRVEKMIEGLGKRMIGWDEVLELHADGIGHEVAVTYPDGSEQDPRRPGTIIQSWRDPSGVEAAARLGHNVIASNQRWTYLNYSHRRLPLETAHEFSPVPEGLGPEQARNVLGVEACLWGGLRSKEQREVQLLPRVAAIAECGWSPPGKHDLADFRNALIRHRRRWEVMGLASHPVGWVEVTYEHPACRMGTVSEFELEFRVKNGGDEPVEITAAPAEGTGVRMAPEVLSGTVGAGTSRAFRAVFSSTTGWDMRNPVPFRMNWQSAYGTAVEKWSQSIAPEAKFAVPEATPDGLLTFWHDRMPFAVGSEARFGVCRDEGAVYVGVYVRKAILHTDPGKQPFEQDGVEIRFDGRDDRDRFFSDGEY